jgi:hypothetical protein
MGDDLCSKSKIRDALDRSGNVCRDRRVARFDHVHADPVEQFGDLHFFIHSKVDIGSLFAFA